MKIKGDYLKIKRYIFEIASAVLTALVIIMLWWLLKRLDLQNIVYNIINQDNCGNIITLSTIFIGIYITLITIIATANMPITKYLYEKNMYVKLSMTIRIGLYTNLILIICLIFFTEFKIMKCLIIFLLIYSIILFLRLISIMVLIYHCNVMDNYKETNKQKKNQDDLITACKHIDNLLTRSNK